MFLFWDTGLLEIPSRDVNKVAVYPPVRIPPPHLDQIFPGRVISTRNGRLGPLERHRAPGFTRAGTHRGLPEVDRFLRRRVPFVHNTNNQLLL